MQHLKQYISKLEQDTFVILMLLVIGDAVHCQYIFTTQENNHHNRLVAEWMSQALKKLILKFLVKLSLATLLQLMGIGVAALYVIME